MKKHVARISAAAFLVMLCLAQVSMAAEECPAGENGETVIVDGREYIIATSYSVYVNTPCTHRVNGAVAATITITGYSGETCTYTMYGYVKTCNLCGEMLEAGTLEYPKDTPDHTYKAYLTSSFTDIGHIYENRCTKCGFVLEAWTEAHNYTDVLAECNGSTHTYKTYCLTCRFILKTWTTRCKPPCDFYLTRIDEPNHDH